MPTEGGASQGILKVQFHALRDCNFEWPSEEAVQPGSLPPLPKNIVKNFIQSFFKEKGNALVRREGDRLKE
jgi:hypothetical protein